MTDRDRDREGGRWRRERNYGVMISSYKMTLICHFQISDETVFRVDLILVSLLMAYQPSGII